MMNSINVHLRVKFLPMYHEYLTIVLVEFGSIGIAPTQNCTHYLKIGFVVAGGGFSPIISIKEKIVRKKLSFMHTKIFYTFFKRWMQGGQFHVYS